MREHCVPINELIDMVMNGDIAAADIVKHETVAWITKEENQRLRKAGYEHSRPGGWQKCYAECGIEVVKL
jgi:hypothetical protein